MEAMRAYEGLHRARASLCLLQIFFYDTGFKGHLEAVKPCQKLVEQIV